MEWIKEKFIYIVLIYINFNFILRLMEKGIYIKNFNYGFTSLLFVLGLSIYWFYNYLLRKTTYKLLFTLFLLSMATTYYLNKVEAVSLMFNDYFLKSVIIVNDLIYEGSITYFYQYKIILILGIPIITALILWVTFKIMRKFILILSLAVVIGLWFSRSYFVVKEYLFVYIFLSSLTFIIITYIKQIQKCKDEGVGVSLKFHYILLYGVIISLLISKITLMLPQEYKGRDFTYFGNYFENKFISKTSSQNKDEYNLANSGYSNNDKKLGGPIALSYQDVFKVKSDKPYYLKGNVSDFYDGNKWSKPNQRLYEKLSSKDMDFLGYGGRKTGIKNSLTIYPDKRFKTNTIFVPNYTFNVSGVEGTLFYDKSPIVLSEETVKEDYTISFYKNEESIDTIEEVNNFIGELRSGRKKILEPGVELLLSSMITYFLPMDYLIRPKPRDVNTLTDKKTSITDKFLYGSSEDFKIALNYGEYLQVPENISNRTYDLVENITKDAHTSIDKVLKIKKYLTNNYVYDLDVSVIPEGSEFIDYFLFQEKKGYCTYFNTAMTVMCRMAGVPARYVEGFKTPNKKDDSGLYSVSNADAHAWCEVLLGASQYSNMWTIVDASPTATEDVQKKLNEIQKQQESTEGISDSNKNTTSKTQNKLKNIESAKEEETSKVGLLSDLQLKVINILIPVILFILMRIIKVIKRRKKLLGSNGIVPLYNYYLYRLEVIMIVKSEYQSDLEFAQKIGNFELKKRMEILVRGSYEEFYGKHSVVTLNNKEYYEFLEGYLKKYQGWEMYLKNKYLGTLE